MEFRSYRCFLAFLLLSPLSPTRSEKNILESRDENPKLPFDPNTTKFCTWWFDSDGTFDCASLPAFWGITLADFLRWNPSISPACTNFSVGKSYCVEARGEPVESTTIGSKKTSTSMTQKATSTTSTISTKTFSNGVSTPTPTQRNIVSDCNEFYFVSPGEGCEDIASKSSIPVSLFYTWNPSVGSDCGGLWANAYACIRVIGYMKATTPTTKQVTTSTTSNGIYTPTPTQQTLVSNCNAFYFVSLNEDCAIIAAKNGISLPRFYTWNPSVGTDCHGLWANAYACVGIIGFTKPTTMTKTGNGITTPTPIQTGMTTSCKTFHYVASGETCQNVLDGAGITLQQFYSWNPAVGSICSGLWANTYCCIEIL